MKNNEIISIDEAIIHCYETYYERDDLCREYRDEHIQLAKWLEELKECREAINRQKAEIERLEKESTDKERAYTVEYCLRKELKTELKTAKSEAIKEFMDSFKRNAIIVHKTHSGKHWYEINNEELDNLAKEMAEVN